MSDEINLEPITYRAEYHASSETGMRYTITAVLDEEWGWGASISVSSFGMKSPAQAVKELAVCLEDALKAVRSSLVKVAPAPRA